MIRAFLLGILMLAGTSPLLADQGETAANVSTPTFGAAVAASPERKDATTQYPRTPPPLIRLPGFTRSLATGQNHSRDFARPAAVQPSLTNTTDPTFCSPVAYSLDPANNTAQLHADAISNLLPATATGPLTLELWAFDTPFFSNTQSGHAIAGSAPFGPLGPGQTLLDVTVTAPFASPPAGSYYLTIFLSEKSPTCFSPSGYCRVSSGNFAGRLTFPLVAPPPPFTIGNYISGNWFDPTPGQDGHGVQFEALPDNGMLAIWFVFTPDGTGQTWLYAQGAYDPATNTVTLPTYLSLGAKFPPNFNHVDDTVTQWGTLTFTFTDCNNGTLSWTSTTAGYPPSGSFPIRRATSIAGASCP